MYIYIYIYIYTYMYIYSKQPLQWFIAHVLTD